MKTTPFDLTQIEADLILNFRNNKRIIRKRKLMRDVSVAVAPNYFASPQDSICEVLKNRIQDNGFLIPDFSSVATCNDGFANYDLGQDCYLHVTWYKMTSGNFEIVAYVS